MAGHAARVGSLAWNSFILSRYVAFAWREMSLTSFSFSFLKEIEIMM